VNQCRHITTTAAKALFGFNKDSKPEVKELRHAYFEAAKQCHPDMQRQNENDETAHVLLDFRDITEAYEHLLNGKHVRDGEDFRISLDEEDQYRQACLHILGIPADVVEESKQNPMFRQWLSGNTDGAQYWRAFFSAHGGLAQKLRPPAGYLETKRGRSMSETRRKRVRR
jgi:hypothetical protein